MEGVVKDVPVPNEVPPVKVAYQLTVPADTVAPRTTVPGPQCPPETKPLMLGIGLTVAVIAVLEAVVHSSDVAST